VDLQNDFLPGGTLAVPAGDAVIPIANRVQRGFDLIVATQDWHPRGHGSFAVNHRAKTPGDVVNLNGLRQVLWPVHCVQETRGAEITTSSRVLAGARAARQKPSASRGKLKSLPSRKSSRRRARTMVRAKA